MLKDTRRAHNDLVDADVNEDAANVIIDLFQEVGADVTTKSDLQPLSHTLDSVEEKLTSVSEKVASVSEKLSNLEGQLTHLARFNYGVGGTILVAFLLMLIRVLFFSG